MKILPALCSASLLLTSVSPAAIVMYAEYHLGEMGSLGSNNLPLDSSVNSRNFANQISGTAATVGTLGVFAPGSTAYLDTSVAGDQGWYSTNLFSGLQTDNFAFSIYARASNNAAGAAEGDVFTLGGGNGAFKLSLTPSGWQASSNNVQVFGGTGTFTADAWVHLAVIRQNGLSTFYVNGVPLGGTFAGAPLNDTPHISVNPGGAKFFDGQVDEARVVTFTSSDSTANILNALQAVPEPSVGVLGAVGLLALARRRR